MKRISRTFGALVFCVIFNNASSYTQIVAIHTIVSGTENASVADFTYGWKFTVDPSTSISVTHLGLLDMQASGFLEEHRVGIWDSGNNLVVEATLAAGQSGTLENGFRFVAVTPAILQAGQSYSIGSWNLGASDNAITGAHFSTEYADEIDFVSASDAPSSGFAAPSHSNSLSHGYFGPNFKGDLTAVPEPREYMMMTVAALGAFAFFRRRRELRHQAV